MNESLLLLTYQVKMDQQPMGGYKNQLTGKYERKFSVSNISLLNSLFTLENLSLLTF